MAEARSPAATVDTIDESAAAKSMLPNAELFVMSVLGGMFIMLYNIWMTVRPQTAPASAAARTA